MKTEKEIKKEIEELKVKLVTCFCPKFEGSKDWAEGFLGGLEWTVK